MSNQSKSESRKEITITRLFNADRETVFKMWTEAEHVSKWYGPKGFSVADSRVDPKPGGEFFINMKSKDGKIYPSTGIFKEVSPPDKLVFSLISHFDDNGIPQVEMLNTLIFKEEHGKTKMILVIIESKTISGVEPLKGLDFAWNQSFDKMAEALNT